MYDATIALTGFTLEKNSVGPIKLRRVSNYGGLLLAATSLSACGSGGGESASTAPTAPTTPTSPVSIPTGASSLTLTKTSGGYQSSSLAGFTLLENNSKYFVADQVTSNAYDVTINASGAGLLEFEFSDADDVVTFLSGSVIDGFSQLKVLHGTVDFSEVDLTGVKYVAVASSAQFSFAQANALEVIVSNSAEGKITFKVATQAQAELLQAKIANGSLKAFGEGSAIDLVAEAGSGLSAATLTEVAQAMNSSVAPVSENVFAELPTNLVTLTTASGTVVSVISSGGGVSSGGSTPAVPVAEPNPFISGEVDLFNIQTSALSSGKYTVDVYLENIFPDLATGVPAFDITFSLSGTGLSLVAGSVDIQSVSPANPASLRMFVPNADVGGRVIAVYNPAHKFTNFSDFLVSFDVNKAADSSDNLGIEFARIDIGGNILGTSTYSLDI